jgi:hypothetical protein
MRAGRERLGHALREHDLHDVAVLDVLLGPAHGFLEGGFTEDRDGRLRRRRGFGWNLHRRTQLGEEFLQPGLRLLVGAGHPRLRVDHQRQLAGEVVDHRQFFRENSRMSGVPRSPGFCVRVSLVST